MEKLFDPGTDIPQGGDHPLEIYDLGRIEYTKALELQRHYHRKVIEGAQSDVLLACAHDPVFTKGTSTLDEHLYVSAEQMTDQGLPVVAIERGGSVTYHGPEQAIIYPIINLHHHRTDVGWYMRSLEEVAIRVLAKYGINGIRIAGKTGVWIDDNTKIAFSGVRISRWCTLHGLSLNVLNCADRFAMINPCGLGAIEVTSIAQLTNTMPDTRAVLTELIGSFIEVFGYDLVGV
ncbi:MAG: lipoyl(octanoyl) transferase LipB [Pseudomonadota bacterium]|jgi:lipoyl(octanoyl) transferase